MSFMTLIKSVFSTDEIENAHSTEIVDTFTDDDHATVGVNPCSGLPMTDSNSMIDVGGNVYGTCSDDADSSFIDDNSSSFDDSYDSTSSLDDGFSDDSWNDC